MKLHLPKRLLTALLAAFTAISLSTGSAAWGIATSDKKYFFDKSTGELYYYNADESVYYSAKTGTVAQEQPDANSLTGVTMYIGTDNKSMTSDNVTADEGKMIGFQLGDNGTTTSWFDSTTTFIKDLLIYDENSGDNAKQGLVISNGNGEKTIEFQGAVYGNGVLYKRGAGKLNTWKFTGDVTHFTGDILLNHSDNAYSTFTIQFGKDDGSSAVRGSKDAGVAGTGAITFNNAYGKVIFNYSDSDSATPVPVYITNSINATGNGVSKVELAGNADVVFTNNVTIHELTTNASSITFSNTSHIGKATSTIDFKGGDMIVNDAATVTLNGIISNIGTVKANSNASLNLTGALLVNTDTSTSLNLTGASISISELRGAGTVILTSNTDSKSEFSAFVGTGFTGDIALNHSAEKTTVALTIGQDSTAKIKANSDSTIDNLSLASGATLRYNTKKYTSPTTTPIQGYTYTLKNVEIGGGEYNY